MAQLEEPAALSQLTWDSPDCSCVSAVVARLSRPHDLWLVCIGQSGRHLLCGTCFGSRLAAGFDECLASSKNSSNLLLHRLRVGSDEPATENTATAEAATAEAAAAEAATGAAAEGTAGRRERSVERGCTECRTRCLGAEAEAAAGGRLPKSGLTEGRSTEGGDCRLGNGSRSSGACILKGQRALAAFEPAVCLHDLLLCHARQGFALDRSQAHANLDAHRSGGGILQPADEAAGSIKAELDLVAHRRKGERLLAAGVIFGRAARGE
mmetsp:Transcript_116/g.313  ORF Transcript_116/g.313 Transcript_116/m.313 type:complete len:267 (-) Transcript_116:83-883(-)